MLSYERIWNRVPIGPICSSPLCKEKCCEPNYSRYGLFDYFLLMGSPSEIEKGQIDVPAMIPGTRIRILPRQKIDFSKPCLFFDSNKGCTLAEEDRPIACVTWCCNVVKGHLTNELVSALNQLKWEYFKLKYKATAEVMNELFFKHVFRF